ncbi:MAG: hypothetical protein QOK16_3191 [Solirubrobacteraceae bacterium]|nr:hypothetical protein [Solirubrobacteraceae bacterium]
MHVTLTVRDYRWSGEIAPFVPVFECLRPSSSYRAVLGGVPHDFEVATRADYEAVLRASGSLPDGAALEDNPELVALVQAHWHAAGNNGCHFAMHLSEHRQRFGWETWVMDDRDSPAATADAIADTAESRLEPVEVDVLSFVLPHVETPRALGDVVRLLGARPGWNLVENAEPRSGDLALLGLSVGIDLGHWSEILGFGLGAPLAHTRRAPFTELAIRAKPPRRARPNHRAYMADVPLNQDSATIKLWGDETKRCRAERLGDEQDALGKARVTTVVRIDGSTITP